MRKLLLAAFLFAGCASTPPPAPGKGEASALDAKEFEYFSYYREIRKQLEQAWNVRLRDVFRKQKPEIPEGEARTTGLELTLDETGKILDVRLKKSSGLESLDAAAVEAFRGAGPLKAPPEGLLDKKKHVKVLWDLILQG